MHVPCQRGIRDLVEEKDGLQGTCEDNCTGSNDSQTSRDPQYEIRVELAERQQGWKFQAEHLLNGFHR